MTYYGMGDTLNIGTRAEKLFVQTAIKKKFKVHRSTLKEDMIDHVDYKLTRDGKTYSVDIKGPKRISRGGDWLTDEMWVELKNVQGNPGWVFGKADWIAQQINKQFFIVKREVLIKAIKFKLIDTIVTSPIDALHKKYQRRGRKDILSRIKIADIPLKHWAIWPIA